MSTERDGRGSLALAAGISVSAAVFLLMAGLFQGLLGLAQLLGSNYFIVNDQYVFKFDTTTWGWIHLILGVVAIATAIGIFAAATWARLTGIVVALLSALATFGWLPYQPWWSILLIVIDGVIIWALINFDRARF